MINKNDHVLITGHFLFRLDCEKTLDFEKIAEIDQN
jgi:hypothetical protein